MKKLCLLCFGMVFTAASLYAAPKKLFFDNFDLPLKRTNWLKFPPSKEVSEKSVTLDVSGVRWLVRSHGDLNLLNRFVVTNADGKIIMQSKKLQKFDWVNFHGKKPYTVKVSIKPSEKSYSIALDVHDNEDKTLPGWKSRQMLSWHLVNSSALPADGGGVKLVPAKQGKARIFSPFYDAQANVKYRAELRITSPKAQKVTFRISCKGAKKDVVQELQPGKTVTLSAEFVNKGGSVTSQLYFTDEVKLDKFYLWKDK